jgi:hypothetical protein
MLIMVLLDRAGQRALQSDACIWAVCKHKYSPTSCHSSSTEECASGGSGCLWLLLDRAGQRALQSDACIWPVCKHKYSPVINNTFSPLSVTSGYYMFTCISVNKLEIRIRFLFSG